MFRVIENKEKIASIKIPIDVHCICAIGKETYTAQTIIEINDADFYPEFIEFQQWIYDTFEDKELNIERYVTDLGTAIHEACKAQVVITVFVDDARKHFPVTESRTWEKKNKLNG